MCLNSIAHVYSVLSASCATMSGATFFSGNPYFSPPKSTPTLNELRNSGIKYFCLKFFLGVPWCISIGLDPFVRTLKIDRFLRHKKKKHIYIYIYIYTGWRISKDTIQTYFSENIRERANAACMCVLTALFELLRWQNLPIWSLLLHNPLFCWCQITEKT